MKIYYEEKEIELAWSITAMRLFEDIMKRPYKGASINDSIVMMYVLTVVSSGAKNMPVEPFYAWINEHPEMLQKFINWTSEIC